MAEEEKSLAQWRHEIKVIGKKHYLRLYEVKIGKRVSNIARFFKAINDYGEWSVFESIIDCSDRYITGDPLNYVLTVAQNKWKEEQMEMDDDDKYLSSIQLAKDLSTQKNTNLANKLKKAKEVKERLV